MARQARHGKAWMARLGKKARQARHGPDRLAGQGKAGTAWMVRRGTARQGSNYPPLLGVFFASLLGIDKNQANNCFINA